MTAFFWDIIFNVFVVDVCVGFEHLLAEARLEQRLQVHLNRLYSVLDSPRNYFGVKDVGEELVEVVWVLLVALGQISNKCLVHQSNVQIGKMPHYRLTARDNLGNHYFQSPAFMFFWQLIVLQTHVFYLFTAIHILFHVLLAFALKKILVLGIDLTNILIFLHTFFGFVKGHLIAISEVVKNSFGLEVDSGHRLALDQLFNLVDDGLVSWTEENLGVDLEVSERVKTYYRLFFVILDLLERNSELVGLAEVHVVFG